MPKGDTPRDIMKCLIYEVLHKHVSQHAFPEFSSSFPKINGWRSHGYINEKEYDIDSFSDFKAGKWNGLLAKGVIQRHQDTPSSPQISGRLNNF